MAGPYPNDQGNPAAAIPVYVVSGGGGGTVSPIVPKTGGGLVSGLVAKASPGSSYGAEAALAAGSAAGWLVGYNATTIPADGAINPALVLQAIPLPAGPSFAATTDNVAVSYTVGIVYYITSGANPYANKVTTGYTGFISAKVV